MSTYHESSEQGPHASQQGAPSAVGAAAPASSLSGAQGANGADQQPAAKVEPAKATAFAGEATPESVKQAARQGAPSDAATDEPRHHLRFLRWSRLSYTARVTISFALIAFMTAIVAMGVVSIVWEQHFRTYTYENMQSVAETTASQIASRYEKLGAFTSYALQPAEYAVASTQGIGMQVVDGNNAVVFDSTVSPSVSNGSGSSSVAPSLAPVQGKGSTARASIVVDNEQVGSVRVWVNGSDTLLRSADAEFRARSYEAMVVASVIAIVLASLIGFLFARNLVRPIKRMTDTAKTLKEGDFTARTGLSGDDEISQLGETFDAMAESVERDRKLERRLTTDVAHELRTPLMAIQATVEAMVDGVFPTDEEHLMTVDSEVQRLSRLVDSLLKLSRLENRSNPMKQEIVNCGELIQTIVTTHEAYVNEAGLKLIYKADDDAIVKGDPDMIRQATANLISNAVRYTPEGGTITVTVRRGEKMASIAVQDTGIGLTPEEARMVFSRFWRSDSGRNREKGGLGIGLSVVKEIVDRHHGWVQVDGRKNEGACFTINLPLYDEREERRRREADERAQQRSRTATSRIGKGGRSSKGTRNM